MSSNHKEHGGRAEVTPSEATKTRRHEDTRFFCASTAGLGRSITRRREHECGEFRIIHVRGLSRDAGRHASHAGAVEARSSVLPLWSLWFKRSKERMMKVRTLLFLSV